MSVKLPSRILSLNRLTPAGYYASYWPSHATFKLQMTPSDTLPVLRGRHERLLERKSIWGEPIERYRQKQGSKMRLCQSPERAIYYVIQL